MQRNFGTRQTKKEAEQRETERSVIEPLKVNRDIIEVEVTIVLFALFLCKFRYRFHRSIQTHMTV